MSEYQHYEFRTINRVLSKSELEQVKKWSSRGEVTQTSAKFVYNFGDFKQNVEKCLVGYFDMMLYYANYGCRRVMFRFPKDLVDFKKIALYEWGGDDKDYEHSIGIYKSDQYIIIDIEENLEDGFDEWIESDGVLAGITGLWTEIVNGNYACLYLTWLKFATEYMEHKSDDDEDNDDENPDLEEPPIPSGLKKSSAALSNFMDFWEISDDMRVAAAKKSPSNTSETDADLTKYIAKLSDVEKTDYLARFLREEPFLHAKLVQRLRTFLPAKTKTNSTDSRTLSEIKAATVSAAAERLLEEEKTTAQKRRLELENMKNRAPKMWDAIWFNLLKKTGGGYDHAIRELKDLRDLAEYTGNLEDYREKRGEIWEKFKGSKAFVDRVVKAGL
jgi:hypothetical protein